MRIVVTPDRTTWADLIRRPTRKLAEVAESVRPVMEAVRLRGDTAVLEFSERFDGVRPRALRISGDTIRAAGSRVPDELKAAIRTAAANIETFHKAQAHASRRIETTRGVTCWRRSIPIRAVGLYVPGGTAPLFSTVLMLGVPARIAGCPEVVLCTPPNAEGGVHPAILFAANTVGIEQVFAVGGAQAVAAMAHGTETVPRVDKILGPGNQYVTAAKQWAALSGTAIDMPAGPTEVAILAGVGANLEFVAADMLAQAEHGPDSHVFVVASDQEAADSIQAAVAKQLDSLPRGAIAREALEHAVLVVEPDAARAMELINTYAPEHLILLTDDAPLLADRVTQAGSVFVGHLTPESAGDYASGTNHTLPTGGAARAWSGVSLDSFVKNVTFQEVTAEGLSRLGPVVERMARAEGLEGHARAVSIRLDALPDVAPGRVGEVSRSTSETDIYVRIDLDGSGRGRMDTGLGFFDHMLMQIARHGGVDLDVRVQGDLEVDEHHTVEDTALALGAALKQALGDKCGVERYGFLLPMDEALSHVALDFGGRSHLEWDVPFTRERVGDVPTELWQHFFKSLCDAAACNLHVKATGENDHHIIEAVFKGLARALRSAVRRESGSDDIPSTKGVL